MTTAFKAIGFWGVGSEEKTSWCRDADGWKPRPPFWGKQERYCQVLKENPALVPGIMTCQRHAQSPAKDPARPPPLRRSGSNVSAEEFAPVVWVTCRPSS